MFFFLNLRPGWLKVKDIQPLGRGRAKPLIIGCQLPAARWWEPKFIAGRDREAGDFSLKPVGNVPAKCQLRFLSCSPWRILLGQFEVLGFVREDRIGDKSYNNALEASTIPTMYQTCILQKSPKYPTTSYGWCLVQRILQRFPKPKLKPFAWKECIYRDTTMSRDNRVYPLYLLCSLKIIGDYNPHYIGLIFAYIGISHTLTLAVWPFAGHHVARRVRTESTSSGAASWGSLGAFEGRPEIPSEQCSVDIGHFCYLWWGC